MEREAWGQADTDTRRVRVRVNSSGRRYVGIVRLPDGVRRVSDVLNDGLHFLYLEDVHTLEEGHSGNHALALNKATVTFIQALEEPVANDPARRLHGDFLMVQVAMKHMDLRIQGKIFLPDGASPPDVINDERDFLSLSDAEVVGTNERFPYLALSKSQVMALEVVGQAELPTRS